MSLYNTFNDLFNDKENSSSSGNVLAGITTNCNHLHLTKRKRPSPLKQQNELHKKRQKYSLLSLSDPTPASPPTSLRCDEILPDIIPDIPTNSEAKLSVSPLPDLSWLDLDISPTTMQNLFSSPNASFNIDQPPIHREAVGIPLLDDSEQLDPPQLDIPYVNHSMPYHPISSFLPRPVTNEPLSLDEILAAEYSNPAPFPPTAQPSLNTMISTVATPQITAPGRLSRSLNSQSMAADKYDTIRISWLNNSNKSGWTAISPFPRAISKPKKLLIEPIHVETANLRLFVKVETDGVQQLHVVTQNGSSSSMEVPILPIDTEPSTFNPIQDLGSEVLLNCTYNRPGKSKGRPLHHVTITDNLGRQLFNWSVEIFNPKWESMTSSADRPISEQVCTFAWCAKGDNEWRSAKRTLPTK